MIQESDLRLEIALADMFFAPRIRDRALFICSLWSAARPDIPFPFLDSERTILSDDLAEFIKTWGVDRLIEFIDLYSPDHPHDDWRTLITELCPDLQQPTESA